MVFVLGYQWSLLVMMLDYKLVKWMECWLALLLVS